MTVEQHKIDSPREGLTIPRVEGSPWRASSPLGKAVSGSSPTGASGHSTWGGEETSSAPSAEPHRTSGQSPTMSSSPTPTSQGPGLSGQQGAGGQPPHEGMVWGYPYVHTADLKRSWRKRHPFLFWGGLVLLLLLAVNTVAGVSGTHFQGPRIAVVEVNDIILASEPVVNWIEKIRKEPGIKSVVLRVNSPGGAVSPSQEIYYALKRLAAEKPVVTSMGSLAASGGYYVSLGAQEIFANPSTLTASIGVKMQVPNIQGLMQTIGISEKTLVTGNLKDAGNYARDMSPAEEKYFQDLLQDMFDEFVETIMRERKMSRDAVLAVADGRAMTGRQAIKTGLIDHLGDYHDALKKARELGGFAEGEVPPVVIGPVQEKTLLQEAIGAILEFQGQQQSLAQPVFLY